MQQTAVSTDGAGHGLTSAGAYQFGRADGAADQRDDHRTFAPFEAHYLYGYMEAQQERRKRVPLATFVAYGDGLEAVEAHADDIPQNSAECSPAVAEADLLANLPKGSPAVAQQGEKRFYNVSDLIADLKAGTFATPIERLPLTTPVRFHNGVEGVISGHSTASTSSYRVSWYDTRLLVVRHKWTDRENFEVMESAADADNSAKPVSAA